MAEKIKGIPIEHITDKEQIYNIYQELMGRLDTLALVRQDKDKLIVCDYKNNCMICMCLDANGNINKIARF